MIKRHAKQEEKLSRKQSRRDEVTWASHDLIDKMAQLGMRNSSLENK